MAVTTRVARGERPNLIMPRSAELGPDEALVGGSDDASTMLVDDDNPLSKLVDEDWDGLSEDQRGKPGAGDRVPRTEPKIKVQDGESEPPRDREEEGEGEEDEEEDVRLAYDDEEGPRGPRGRRARRQSNIRRRNAERDGELEELRAEVQSLRQGQHQMVGSQITRTAAQLEATVGRCDNALQVAQTQLAAAVSAADGDAVARILAERDRISAERWQAVNDYKRLEAQAERFAAGGGAAGGQRQDQQPLTPEQRQQLNEREERFERLRDIFLDRYSWFDPEVDFDEADRDHKIVLRIDRRLAAEGFQRHTKAYWHEMESEMKAAGFRPDQQDRRDEDEDDRRVSRRRWAEDEEDERPMRRRNGGRAMDRRRYNGPPTGGVGSSRRGEGRDRRRGNGGGSDYQLSEIELQMLTDEGLMEDNLSEADEAKKTRLITKWKNGKEAYTARTGRRW